MTGSRQKRKHMARCSAIKMDERKVEMMDIGWAGVNVSVMSSPVYYFKTYLKVSAVVERRQEP